jgi:hypothetical protein
LPAVACLLAAALTPRSATALERFCDPAFEDCRAPLIDLIDRETVGIDVGFWFMEDARYSSALQRAKARGVPIRVLMDTRANDPTQVTFFVSSKSRTPAFRCARRSMAASSTGK